MKIVVFAPHNDDEVLGVGGTINKYSNAGHEVYVCEVTSGPKYLSMQEEARKARKVLGVKDSIFLNLPVVKLKTMEPDSERSFIPDTWVDITDNLEIKMDAMSCYASQIKEYPNPRSNDGIKALAMYRGSTVSVQYAECFMTVRNIIKEI